MSTQLQIQQTRRPNIATANYWTVGVSKQPYANSLWAGTLVLQPGEILSIMTTLITRTSLIGVFISLVLLVVPTSYALIEPLETQQETAKELVDKLESRHYSKQKLDNSLSTRFFVAHSLGGGLI